MRTTETFKLTDKHYEAFFGIVPGKDMKYNADKDFKPLVKMLLEKISQKHPNLTLEILDKGLLAALWFLGKLRYQNPYGITFNRFKHDLLLQDGALTAAFAEINLDIDKRDTLAYQQSQKHTDAETAEIEQSKMTSETLYAAFHNTRRYWIQQGLPETEAMVKSYQNLLQDNPNPVGKVFYDLFCGIPTKYQIYYELAVIEAVNAHPVLPNREKPETVGDLHQHLPDFRGAE